MAYDNESLGFSFDGEISSLWAFSVNEDDFSTKRRCEINNISNNAMGLGLIWTDDVARKHLSSCSLSINTCYQRGIESMNMKEQIDARYTHPSMRKLMYWKYAEEKGCGAEISDSFCAGNQDFANHVIMLLDYAKDLEDKLASLERRS